MRNIGIVAKREINAYFTSPVAYIIMAVFLVVVGFLFAFTTRVASLQSVFLNVNVILLLVAPILTMRLLAEEQHSGTIELLLTSPVRDFELVAGKFLASLVFLVAMLAPTLWYAVLLAALGNPDPGPMLGGYAGMLLFGGSFMAIGLLASSLSQNQIVAAFIGFCILLMFYLVDMAAGFAGGSVGAVLSYVSMAGHLYDFTKGVLDTKDVVYYLSVIGVSLFVTVSLLQMRRWR